LHTGVSEVVTILCLEFADFESFCRGQEPEAVLRTMNQLLAEFEEVFHWRGGHVTGYLGSGLLALVREAGHAERAVHTALDLRAVVAEFNRPRSLLGLPRLPARIGVATGPVFLGNLGTYQYLCFTPVGPVVNLARHLAHQAVPESPCISQETQEQVRDHFVYRPDSPRQVEITAVGASRVWDVADRGRPSSRPSARPS
jgi:class 3 adenylate cyclase